MLRVAAPGKLVFSGAYAVLEGASALVLAVNRYAIASRVPGFVPDEVAAAFDPSDGAAPSIDASGLREGAHKLGLGSSAAAVVAAVGLGAAEKGQSLEDQAIRETIFSRALRAHQSVQRGGSGIDVAASTFGGVLRYRLQSDGTPECSSIHLPRGTIWSAWFSGTGASTTSLRAQLAARANEDRAAYVRILDRLAHASEGAADAITAASLLQALDTFARALAELSTFANAPIFPPAFAELRALASSEGAVFYPSGAGGGDIGLFVGSAVPSEAWKTEAKGRGMTEIAINLDSLGVHVYAPTS